jgi:hypothetical protein
MANTWGTNFWGVNEFGLQDEINVDVTGSSVTTGTSQSTTQADANVFPQGIESSVAVGLATENIAVEVFVQGISITIQPGLADANPDANVIGQSLTTAVSGVTIDDQYLIGSGWGRETWGSFVWGDNYSVQLNGISLSVITGDEDAFTDVIVAVSGTTLQTAINSVGTSANSDHEIAASLLINSVTGDVNIEGNALVELTGISTTTAIGDAEAGLLIEVQVTGVFITTFIGDEDITGNALVTLTGATATGTVGDVVPVSGYDVTGSSASVANGEVTITGSAIVAPTGVGLTVNTISPNIIAWAEVDTGTTVTWTPVDLAA